MRQCWILPVCAVIVAVAGDGESAAGHDLTSYIEPEGPLAAAGLLERAVDAQLADATSGDVGPLMLESFVAAQFTFDPGPVDLCFWNGTVAEQENFIKVANSWFVDTSLVLRATTEGAPISCPAAGFSDFEIRAALGDVSTLEAGDALSSSWSRIGKQGASSPRKVTLFINPSHLLSPTQRDYIIRHEVGHALGLLHEFQRVECGGHFSEKTIKDFYKQRCLGTETQKNTCADRAFKVNIAALVDTSPWGKPIPGGAHDPKSCMNYLVSDSWMADPNDFTCRLREPCPKLSTGDETGIQTVYVPVAAAAPASSAVAAGPSATGTLPVPDSLEEFDALALAAQRELAELRMVADALRKSQSLPTSGGALAVPSIESLPTASGIAERARIDLGTALRNADPATLSVATANLEQEIVAAQQRMSAYTLAPAARALLEAGLGANIR